MSPAEVERQCERIKRAPLVVRETGSTLFRRTSVSTRVLHWTRILGLWLTILPSLNCCVSVEIMNWRTTSWRSLLYLLSQSTWMLRGHTTVSWLVFRFVPYCLPSLCAFSLLRVLVHHSQWAVHSDFVSLHQLGKVTRELQRGVRQTNKAKKCGFFFARGIERHLSEKMCGNVGS